MNSLHNNRKWWANTILTLTSIFIGPIMSFCWFIIVWIMRFISFVLCLDLLIMYYLKGYQYVDKKYNQNERISINTEQFIDFYNASVSLSVIFDETSHIKRKIVFLWELIVILWVVNTICNIAHSIMDTEITELISIWAFGSLVAIFIFHIVYNIIKMHKLDFNFNLD